MCLYSICIDLDYLELFNWNSTEITNVLEGSLHNFYKDISLIVHLLVLEPPLVILNGFSA